MRELIPQKYRIFLFFLLIAILVGSFLLIFLNQSNISIPRKAKQIPSESFTFFEVGENTILTKEKVRTLKKALGQHRLENLTPVYLDFVRRGWLATHFPETQPLHDFFEKNRLRDPIASNTLKLTYRYAHQKNVPFQNIHFVFSAYTNQPMSLFLRLPGRGEAIVSDLKTRYGEPRILDNASVHGPGPTLVWKHKNDLLVVTILWDRYGKPETHIFIAYLDNMKDFQKTIMKFYPEPGIRTGF
ncbi:hypothetical protein OOT00_08455 [Desulfobotulus sp. H1]|uniref:Uncharacterized protein n=1 Tax=Desulfobotulus pelophilus TaxID=2823377 RepID=A0ABT3N977_9BACT|nr:hypothetical protein [Desulfobotulus pelophilus]MCW7754016.1 hypothetical protein [Desulfobotulus pelophilus]